LCQQVRRTSQSRNRHAINRHPGEFVQLIDASTARFTVEEFLSCLLHDFGENNLVTNHREFPAQSWEEFAEGCLDAIWERIPSLV